MKTLYYNGNIYGKNYQPFNSMIVDDEIILNIGDNLDENYDLKVDLQGKTILPSFLDSHSHITSLAMSFLQLDLSNCESIEDIKKALQDYFHKLSPTIINAINYDHNKLKEERHPTRFDIDDAVADIPVVLVHNSNHFGVFNTKALTMLNLEVESGFFEESALVDVLRKVPMPSIDEILKGYTLAQEVYASHGITYVQDGMIVKEMLPIYEKLLKSDLLYLDILGYLNILEKDLLLEKLKKQNDYFHILGYKVILDGSPQGKTAWIQTPYLNSSDFGSGLVSDDDLMRFFDISIKDKMQLIAHCNGDRAAKQFIDTAKCFQIEDLKRIKPVIIHAQLLQIAQLETCYKLHLIPSFFLAHVYYFGDIHIKNLGMNRASLISPVNSAIKHGLKPTLHQDTPVISPNMFETIQISMERMTKNGVLLGSDEKLKLTDALDTVTINVAYQYGLEKECGSLEKGKKASFIIIDQDIFKVLPQEIKTIKVLKTYKNGKCIYEA